MSQPLSRHEAENALVLKSGTISLAPVLKGHADDISHTLSLLGYSDVTKIVDKANSRNVSIKFGNTNQLDEPKTFGEIAGAIRPDYSDPHENDFSTGIYTMVFLDEHDPETQSAEIRLVADI